VFPVVLGSLNLRVFASAALEAKKWIAEQFSPTIFNLSPQEFHPLATILSPLRGPFGC